MARGGRNSPMSLASTPIPAMLHPIIRAAERECPEGHAEALAEMLVLASQKVPSRGIFDPGVRDEPEFDLQIENVAKAHLRLGIARAELRKALKAAKLPIERRDDIESAALEVQGASDTAHYYAGLAFGLVFAAPWRTT